VRFASHYRWLIARHHLGIPVNYSNLLDIGTDQGEWLDHVEASVKIGLDLQQIGGTHNWLVQGNAVHLPFDGESFGDVWAFDVMEHILDDEAFLQELHRVLEPGGRVWMSTTSIQFRIFPGGWIQRRFERGWGHVRRGYTPDTLENLASGFGKIQLVPWSEPLYRTLYPFLYLIAKISQDLCNALVPSIYQYDARRNPSPYGHYFAVLTR
jgi:SAM-dependent methyltransferase